MSPARAADENMIAALHELCRLFGADDLHRGP
jgi:hypothetical protein